MRVERVLSKKLLPLPCSKTECHTEMSPFHINSRTRSIPEPPWQPIYSRGLPSPPCFDYFQAGVESYRRGGSLGDTTFNFNYHFQLRSWQSSLPEPFAGWLHNQPSTKWQQASGTSKDGSQPFETHKTNVYQEERHLFIVISPFFLLYSHNLSIVPRVYS